MNAIHFGTEVCIGSGAGGWPPSRWVVVSWGKGTVDVVRIVGGRRDWGQMQRVSRDLVETWLSK
jgi:hypothetical protein